MSEGRRTLAQQECVPCKAGAPPMDPEEQQQLLRQLGGNWRIEAAHHLACEFGLADFRQALDFTNKIGELAEAQGHHPDLTLSWGKVGVTIWTHKIDGLTPSDFILAAKISSAYPSQ